MHNYTLFEVLSYGPIVAWDEASGIIITVSKVCFSAWTCTNNGKFVGSKTCLITELEKVGDCTDFDLVCEVGNEWLQELLAESEDDEPTN